MIKTKQFKQWFGKSKMMDHNKPRIFYHGVGGGDEIVVFESTQIKSINNNGSFGKTTNIFESFKNIYL